MNLEKFLYMYEKMLIKKLMLLKFIDHKIKNAARPFTCLPSIIYFEITVLTYLL